ncbi:acetamidase/formamidase family protein [Paenibacillus sp. BSR1-1]|uniref:acetamidase/formamidase family protein n=1 Tax=Paenibacillus sp. BSR1-1 TaxID=3020845 RepID=UPI0025AF9514|nr:acetamidase/formamidase family protein [Paenibacillus sp. BSR1-1]MDN3019566.1 acetamidase/formamidase family protein [Paenibacillus sp. BSR1-1]
MFVNQSNLIYAFSKENKPVLQVDSGTQVVIETCDCFENQIVSEDVSYHAMDWDKVNPATGPIFVNGAVAGDILAVTIDEIELAEQGVMAVSPGMGVLGDCIEEFEAKLIPIRDGKAVFNDKIEFPLNPMIGVIGVAPKDGAVSCGTPGSHGGNMDNKMITTGATLYFPVHADGALFALGDLHAAMGDGEIGVTGIEIAAKVTVTLKVIKGFSIENPILESEEFISTIASEETLDLAVKRSVEDMVAFLEERIDLSFNQINMLCSAVGQTQICQVVDPLVTARFLFPKWVLGKYGSGIF